jgi:hypothetical protein
MIVNHWLVEHRQQLLGDNRCDGIKPGTGAASENDCHAKNPLDLNSGYQIGCYLPSGEGMDVILTHIPGVATFGVRLFIKHAFSA